MKEKWIANCDRVFKIVEKTGKSKFLMEVKHFKLLFMVLKQHERSEKILKKTILFVFALQQQEQDPTNLYISNLPVSMDEQELESMLKPFGQVISTRILRDANGTSRGVGFARFDKLFLRYIILICLLLLLQTLKLFPFLSEWSRQRNARP